MNNKLFISHKNTHLRFYNFILSTKKSYSVFLISCICFFFSTNPLIAQSVSLNFNNASYEQIFNTIEQKTDINLFITHKKSTNTVYALSL